MIVGTKIEFENLADYILRDYLGSEYESYKPFDVIAFAKDYLKLDISYCEFNPEDNIEGMRTGNQILLDQRLSEPTRVGERNFTIAHECGHDLINWQEPNYVPDQTINYRIRSQHKELKTENDFREWQANVVASCLLLRPPLVGWALFTFVTLNQHSAGQSCLDISIFPPVEIDSSSYHTDLYRFNKIFHSAP